jgi:hypothetical protein
MLKFIHVPIIPESIGAVQSMRHQDLETIDGSGTTTESTTPWPDVPNPDVMVRNYHTQSQYPDVLYSYVAPDCCHHTDNLNPSNYLSFNDPPTAPLLTYLETGGFTLLILYPPHLRITFVWPHVPDTVQTCHSQITYYFDTISVTSSIWITQTSNKLSMTRTTH